MGVKTNEILVDSFPDESVKLLLSLATDWGDVITDLTSFEVVRLSGAMTNKVYQISWPTEEIENPARTVLVRIYGEGVERFFNRDDEIRTFDCLSTLGYGPKLLGHFKGGRVEEFIHSRTLSAPDLRDPEISSLVAAKMRELHKLDIPGPNKVDIWDRLRNWVTQAKILCSADCIKKFQVDNLEEEITLLEKAISGKHQEIRFCHNDLQCGNIMINDKTKSITLIDYEYASYNPVAYDIATHFCEWAGNHHPDKPHIVDYTKYPDLDERRRFIRQYLISDAGNEPSDVEIEKLGEDVEKYTLANHICFGLWGIISAHVNHIDFDYLGYARQRFEQYWLRKKELLHGHE